MDKELKQHMSSASNQKLDIKDLYAKEREAAQNASPTATAAFFQNWDDDDYFKPTGIKPNPAGTHSINGIISPDPWGMHDIPKKSCYHEWKIYTGLNEQFEFCTKCDIKKGENK
jgi:hypothetical protein